MYTPHTITVFNAVKGAGNATGYQSTVLSGVFRDYSRAEAIGSNGYQKAGGITVFIPQSVTAQSNRTYVPPTTFGSLTADEQESHWTLSEKGDFFVNGEIIPQTQEGIRYEQYRSTEGCHKIETVEFYDYGSAEHRHWEVTGK